MRSARSVNWSSYDLCVPAIQQEGGGAAAHDRASADGEQRQDAGEEPGEGGARRGEEPAPEEEPGAAEQLGGAVCTQKSCPKVSVRCLHVTLELAVTQQRRCPR